MAGLTALLSEDAHVTRIDDRGPPILVDAAARERLAAALDREPVVAAYLFGSQARGTPGPLSDVDVAVWTYGTGEDPLGLRLAGLACEALRTDEVDLVVLDDAPPLLRHRVLRDGMRLVDRDPTERVRREAWTYVEYLDTQPLRDELARGLRNAIQEGTFGRPRRRP